ncbi:hypothetical protein [Methylobacterium sp. PvR107]|uniref:hypothetical protein n=1 Tax=Methylobacterium sp. PvR107 TaxID=2806597 RepID=UPI001B4004A4|nr:hypothetical protein [Methylobacterium sp. PvR107]
MAESDGQPLTLQVANARPQDGGRGIARLPQASLAELGPPEGDIIEIVGKRHTAAVAVGPYAEDQGLSPIRRDGLQRVNAGASSGDPVEVRRAEIRPATRMVVAPAQNNVRRPLIAGDVFATATQRSGGPDPRLPPQRRS